MNGVNLELMQNLVQVTLQGKTVNSNSTSNDSSTSFSTILEDIEKQGIQLSDEQVESYKTMVDEENIDLDTLHNLLQSVNINTIVVEEETSENILQLLVDANVEVSEEKTEEQIIADTMKIVEETLGKSKKKNESKESEENVEASMTQMTVTLPTEVVEEVVNETVKVDEANVTLNYTRKPEYHEPTFDFNGENVIVSDNDVMKLDLMYKDLFEDVETEAMPFEVSKSMNDVLSADMEIVSVTKPSDFEKAYVQLQSIRPITQNYSLDVRSEEVQTSTHHWVDIQPADLTNQITESFAKQVNLNSEFVIKLRPEGLGEIVVKMVSDTNGTSTVSMITNNQQVKAILESNMNELKSSLLQQNVEVKDVEFDNQSSYFSESNFSKEQQAHQQRQQNQTFYSSRNEDDDVPSMSTTEFLSSRILSQYV